MQTIFIEEKLSHEQILGLCELIDSNACKSLEFRRCAILETDFDQLMRSLSQKNRSIVSLIFNIQMIDEPTRFQKFIHMLRSCSTLINLRIHGNNLTDEMFAQLYAVLYEHCPRLALLDVGDNRLTNRSIVNLCSLIVPNDKRTGLEELILSANRLITNAGWTELLFSISFNSRIRRLALDYNAIDDTIAAMLSMVIASSRTMTHVDLESCGLSQYAGQLFLSLFTKYPVKLEELYLEKNPLVADVTRTSIGECLGLKSRRNSNERPLSHRRPSIRDDGSSTNSINNEQPQPVKLKKKKKRSSLRESSRSAAREEPKSVGFSEVKKSAKPTETKTEKVQKKGEGKEEEEIEELLPVEVHPYGTVGRLPYWHRV